MKDLSEEIKQWHRLSPKEKKLNEPTPLDYWLNVFWEGRDYKLLSKLCEVVFSVRINSANCERIFSQAGRLKTKRNSTLSDEILSMLLQLKIAQRSSPKKSIHKLPSTETVKPREYFLLTTQNRLKRLSVNKVAVEPEQTSVENMSKSKVVGEAEDQANVVVVEEELANMEADETQEVVKDEAEEGDKGNPEEILDIPLNVTDEELLDAFSSLSLQEREEDVSERIQFEQQSEINQTETLSTLTQRLTWSLENELRSNETASPESLSARIHLKSKQDPMKIHESKSIRQMHIHVFHLYYAWHRVTGASRVEGLAERYSRFLELEVNTKTFLKPKTPQREKLKADLKKFINNGSRGS